MTSQNYRSAGRMLTLRIAVAVAALSSLGCGPKQPDEETLIWHRWVTRLDRELGAYTCPQAEKAALAAEDPFLAAADLVSRAKQLEHWTTGNEDVPLPTPENLKPGLDSLHAAVARIAAAYERSVGMIPITQRECYGPSALRCSRKPQAVNLFYLVDRASVEEGTAAYQRHRTRLAQIFAKEGAPLGESVVCGVAP